MPISADIIRPIRSILMNVQPIMLAFQRVNADGPEERTVQSVDVPTRRQPLLSRLTGEDVTNIKRNISAYYSPFWMT
jgi:hypothetical protein